MSAFRDQKSQNCVVNRDKIQRRLDKREGRGGDGMAGMTKSTSEEYEGRLSQVKSGQPQGI